MERVRDSLQGAPDPDRRRELQRILYGLYAIIGLHFAKEEELYLPLLDAGLGSAEAAEMFRAMHGVGSRGRLGRPQPAHPAQVAKVSELQSWEEKHRGASRKSSERRQTMSARLPFASRAGEERQVKAIETTLYTSFRAFISRHAVLTYRVTLVFALTIWVHGASLSSPPDPVPSKAQAMS